MARLIAEEGRRASPSSSSKPRRPSKQPVAYRSRRLKSVASIRKLIDEASDLSVRANGSPWSAIQTMGDFGGVNGRNVMMSATVQKLLRFGRAKFAALQVGGI